MTLYQISEESLFLFHQGTNYHAHRFLGCHPIDHDGQIGKRFSVWAPNAWRIFLVGDFNNWNGDSHELKKINQSGVWSGFFRHIPAGAAYKYKVVTKEGAVYLKADPYARQSELRPAQASIVPDESVHQWLDQAWLQKKKVFEAKKAPISIYEVHLGSWKQKKEGEFYTYRELAKQLIPYVQSLGFTHIELLPLAEHPLDLSWGYQITGFFSVTARYGTPDDFKYFVDECHRQGLGVIIDWVPGHFCKDDFGLRQFDGKPLYEYADPLKAEKHAWGTLAFDFGRPEVQSFLISNALFWFEEYHIDGLRIDAVASMLNLNFDRREGEQKIYNSYGGEENLEAYAFLKKLNEVIFAYEPNALMMAEDSSDMPLVTAPTYAGGIGFNYKWNMGWMNDLLSYMEKDPVHRKWHHQLLTFSFMYTYSENFLLPLSHDEVVHGKKSLLDKMPGDQWQQFANLRLLYGYLMTHPGKKLLFMGGEFGQYAEWKELEELDWHLLEYPLHRGIHRYIKALHELYRSHAELYELDHDPSGFEWIDPHNIDQSIIAFRRKQTKGEELIIILNFTPVVRYEYKVGVPTPGIYKEIFSSDQPEYGGSGQINEAFHFSIPEKWHGLQQHIKVKVPPLAMSIFKFENTTANQEETAI